MKQAVKIQNASAYLMRFDPPPPANDAPTIAAAAQQAEPNTPKEILSTPTPVDDELPAAIDPAELTAQFEARLATMLAEEKVRAADALEKARIEWVKKDNDSLVATLDAALTRGFAEIRDDIAHVLRPLIAETINSKTFDAFLNDILTCAAGNSVGTMEIRGPADIIERIKTAVKPFNFAIVAHESDETEVHVDFGVTKIVTRLSADLPEILNEGRTADERK